MNASKALVATLLAIAALYAAWFAYRGDMLGAAVFASPPLLLAVLHRWNARVIAFLAGVFALAWFSHGVMLAWSSPDDRGFALGAIALSVLAIIVANFIALRARFGRPRHP